MLLIRFGGAISSTSVRRIDNSMVGTPVPMPNGLRLGRLCWSGIDGSVRAQTRSDVPDVIRN